VCITEGEKDADTLNKLEQCYHLIRVVLMLLDAYGDFFAGKDVIVFPEQRSGRR